MAGYQFLHIEGYSRAGSTQTHEKKARPKTGDTPVRKKTKTFDKWSIHEIADEALRVEGACGHVESPKPATVLHGAGLREAVADAEAWASGMTDAQGRKLRKDGLCLLAGVISLPRERIDEWPAFQQGALEWLKAKYGERLRCVVEHLDEAHPHLHFYAVPLAGERFDAIHDGKAAVARVKAAGVATKGDQNLAYKTAMRGLQDNFWSEFAAGWGLARIGPGRQRLGRAEWKLEQDRAESTATIWQAFKQRLSDATAALGAARRDFMADAMRTVLESVKSALDGLAAREAAVKADERQLGQWLADARQQREAHERELVMREGQLAYREQFLERWAEENGVEPPTTDPDYRP